MIDRDLFERYRFFHEHAGWCSPPGKVACALALARAEERAEELGLSVTWEDEMDPWDGDCAAPRYHLMASVYHPDRPEPCHFGHPHYFVLAHLGGIGLNSLDDPYKRVVEAELFAEAIETIEAEISRNAIAYERERMTFASGGEHAGA